MKGPLTLRTCLLGLGGLALVSMSVPRAAEAQIGDPWETARQLYEQGADTTTCAAKLERHFDLTAAETAEVLTEVYAIDITPCADALETVYYMDWNEAAQTCSRCPAPSLIHTSEKSTRYWRPRWMGALEDEGECDGYNEVCTAGNLGGRCQQDADCDLRLSHLSIPGTHDTCSRYGGWPVYCQSLTLPRQLNAGIRALDIRVKPKCFSMGLPDVPPVEKLAIVHGDFDQKITFPEVLQQTASFLARHPTETILMRVKDEGAAWGRCPLDGHPYPGFAALILRELEATFQHGECDATGTCVAGAVDASCQQDADCDVPFSDFVWWNDESVADRYCAPAISGMYPNPDSLDAGGRCSAASDCGPDYECVDTAPRLADVRRKIVVLRDFGGLEEAGVSYPCGGKYCFGGSPRFFMQDDYFMWFTKASFQRKRRQVKEHLDWSGNYYCRPPLSCSPADWPKRLGDLDRDRDWFFVNYISGSTRVNPIDVARGADIAGWGWEEGMTESAHDHLKYLGGLFPRDRTGIVMTDFPGPPLIDAIVAHNPPGLPAGHPDALPATCWDVEEYRCGIGPELLPVMAVLWWFPRRAQRRIELF